MKKQEKPGWRSELETKERQLLEAYGFVQGKDFNSGYKTIQVEELSDNEWADF